MESSPMSKLPQDPLYQIFSSLPLRQIAISRSVCKSLHHSLSSPPFLSLLSSRLPLLALRPPHHPPPRRSASAPPPPPPSLRAFDPSESRWLSVPLAFLPFRSPHPVASSGGLVYLWAEPPAADSSSSPAAASPAAKSLIVCNPLTREFRVLPQLGSAWSRHGSVLVDSDKGVIVLTELAALYLPKYPPNQPWLTFSSNLPSKPRSPVLVGDSVFAVCDVGSPWRSQWKLFSCSLSNLNCNRVGGGGTVSFSSHNNWVCVERKEWGDVMDIMKRPRLVQGARGSLLMVGGLKSTFSLNPICSTILMLRLDLERMEWEEAGRMPLEMYRCFAECSKLKVFGSGDKVCFSAKRLGKLALWDESEDNGGGEVWSWVDGVPGGSAGEGLFRGFIFEARLDASP